MERDGDTELLQMPESMVSSANTDIGAGAGAGTSRNAGEARAELSMLRRYLADWRSMLPGPSAGIMQLMYPPLGAAVVAQSGFYEDPMGRVIRSIPQIWATVLDDSGPERGRALRDVHRSIKGKDEHGRGFHALDAETFWWAHATFTWEVFRSIELFHAGGLRGVDRDRLYEETVGWYGLYGMPFRPVPETYPEFEDKFWGICDEVLELTPAAERVVAMDARSRPQSARSLAGYGALVAGQAAGRVLTYGCMPSGVRSRIGVGWGPLDQAAFEVFKVGVRNGFRLVPRRVNAATLSLGQRLVGSATRAGRYRPHPTPT